MDWPTPTTIKEVQQFLSFAKFYCKFIRNFSLVAIPISTPTKGNNFLMEPKDQLRLRRAQTPLHVCSYSDHYRLLAVSLFPGWSATRFSSLVTPSILHATRTLEFLQRWFLWPTIKKDVQAFVAACPICNQGKAPSCSPQGSSTLYPSLISLSCTSPWTFSWGFHHHKVKPTYSSLSTDFPRLQVNFLTQTTHC